MGLAARTAMPIAIAAALMCAPLAAQTRPSESNPKRLIEKADRLAWLYNWYLAGPLYTEAEKLYGEAGDSRNALWAKIGRLRSVGDDVVSRGLGIPGGRTRYAVSAERRAASPLDLGRD